MDQGVVLGLRLKEYGLRVNGLGFTKELNYGLRKKIHNP